MFKCKHCQWEIEKDIVDYYRKKENKHIKDLEKRNKNLRLQLAIYHSNKEKYGWKIK